MTSLASSIQTQRVALPVRQNMSAAVAAIVGTQTFSDLAEGEREFLIKARQATQQRAENRKKAALRREADDLAIASIAAAMVEITDSEPVDVACLDRQRVARAAEVNVRVVNRLWLDAVWRARDVDGRLSVAGASMMTSSERERALAAMTHAERERRIAYHALCSAETVDARVDVTERPYSNRQKDIVRRDLQRDEYHRLIADEPCPERLTQTAQQRIVCGYPWTVAARVGGATQKDGQGKYLNLPFVETGFRSNTVKGAPLKRLVAATAKVGTRRRGITDKAKVQRILYLEGIGKSFVEIAADVDESVQRVRAAFWCSLHDSRLRTGLTNDRRLVHLSKWAALDQIHGNLRVDCKDMFRPVDMDRDFEDVHDLMEFIAQRKAKPYLVTWVRDDARPGVVPHPQFFFALPEGSAVWYGECKASSMLEAVAVAICADYGGDIGGLANIFDGKLATSPHTEFICPETEHLLTLGELCKLYDVDLRNDLTYGARQLATKRLADAGVDKTVSNELYTLIVKRGYETARSWEDAGDLRVDANLDRAIFTEQLADALIDDVFIVEKLDTLSAAQRASAEEMLRSAARCVAEKYGRHRRLVSGRGYDVGVAEDEVARAKEMARQQAEIEFAGDPEFEMKVAKAIKRAAQSAGQDYGRRQRNARTVRRIADQIATAVDAGREPTAKEVAKEAGIDLRTVNKRWDEAVTILAANRVVSAVIKTSVANAKKAAEAPAGTSASTPTNNSSEGGVSTTDSQDDVIQTTQQTSDWSQPVIMRLENVLPVQLNRLVNRLRPRNLDSGKIPRGRALLEFVRPGAVHYLSSSGFRLKTPRIGRA